MSEGRALFRLQALEPHGCEENCQVSHIWGAPHREAVGSERVKRGLTKPEPRMAPPRGHVLRVFWNLAIVGSVPFLIFLFSLFTPPKLVGVLVVGAYFER